MAPKPGIDPKFIQPFQSRASDVVAISKAAIDNMNKNIAEYDRKIKKPSAISQQVDASGNRIYTKVDVDDTLRKLAMLKEIQSAYEAVIAHKDTFGMYSRFDPETARKNLAETKIEYQETLAMLAMQQANVAKNTTVGQAQPQPEVKAQQGAQDKKDKWAFRHTGVRTNRETMQLTMAELTRQQSALDQRASTLDDNSGGKTGDDQFNNRLAHLRGVHMGLREKLAQAKAVLQHLQPI